MSFSSTFSAATFSLSKTVRLIFFGQDVKADAILKYFLCCNFFSLSKTVRLIFFVQDAKADVILKYSADEARNLKSYGEMLFRCLSLFMFIFADVYVCQCVSLLMCFYASVCQC